MRSLEKIQSDYGGDAPIRAGFARNKEMLSKFAETLPGFSGTIGKSVRAGDYPANWPRRDNVLRRPLSLPFGRPSDVGSRKAVTRALQLTYGGFTYLDRTGPCR